MRNFQEFYDFICGFIGRPDLTPELISYFTETVCVEGGWRLRSRLNHSFVSYVTSGGSSPTAGDQYMPFLSITKVQYFAAPDVEDTSEQLNRKEAYPLRTYTYLTEEEFTRVQRETTPSYEEFGGFFTYDGKNSVRVYPEIPSNVQVKLFGYFPLPSVNATDNPSEPFSDPVSFKLLSSIYVYGTLSQVFDFLLEQEKSAYFKQKFFQAIDQANIMYSTENGTNSTLVIGEPRK